jgi:radical SAM protein with 4Fe4S-binding SPASM domain
MFDSLGNSYWAKKCGENFVVFHASLGEPFIITAANYARLSERDIDPKMRAQLSEMQFFEDDRIQNACQLKSRAFARDYRGPSVLDLTMSDACNLACHMCSHAQTISHSSTRATTRKLMGIEVARAWIDYYVEQHVPRLGLDKCIFHYGAAEPLLNKRVFLQTLEHVRMRTSSASLGVEQLVNSNLTLLDGDITEALVEHAVKVSVGLDGLAPQNDSIRMTKTGEATYSTIVRNIGILRERGVSVGIALTLTERNLAHVEARKFLETMDGIGISTVLVDSDFIHRVPFDAGIVTDLLLDFYKVGNELGIEILGSWRTPFANLTTENDDEPKSFCTSLLGKNLTVTPTGHLTFCTYSGTPLASYELDDIPSAVAVFVEEMRKLMLKRLPTLNKECMSCPISGLCNGGCFLTSEVTGLADTMCDIYLTATGKLLDYAFRGETI